MVSGFILVAVITQITQNIKTNKDELIRNQLPITNYSDFLIRNQRWAEADMYSAAYSSYYLLW